MGFPDEKWRKDRRGQCLGGLQVGNFCLRDGYVYSYTVSCRRWGNLIPLDYDDGGEATAGGGAVDSLESPFVTKTFIHEQNSFFCSFTSFSAMSSDF